MAADDCGAARTIARSCPQTASPRTRRRPLRRPARPGAESPSAPRSSRCATALSRVAGLGREVVQASFFATGQAFSAFVVASQIPNLFSNLFSQAALSGAFVPIFTELIQQGRKKEAFKLASELFWLILVGLGALTAVWMVVAGWSCRCSPGPCTARRSLTAGLSRVLFPVVLLLSLTGLLVGILQSYDEFTMSALAPAVWNVVIIVLLVVLHGQYHGQHAIYAYAIAWLVATVVQLLLIASALRKIDFRLEMRINWRDPRVRQVLILFFPVTISIGIINIDIFLNAGLGTLVPGGHAPSAINDAFRIYMLPQGVFSVAVATVLFPTLSRQAARRDVGRDAPHARQRDPPDQPAAGSLGGADGRARHSDRPARLPARHLPLGRHQARGSEPCSGSPSACPSPGSTCCCRAPSSRSSGRGSRPSWRRSTSSST